MPPKRTSTSEAPAMTQDAIRKLVADNVTAALEVQGATMANVRRSCWHYLRLVERPNRIIYVAGLAEENKVTFTTGTLTDDALSWWNAYA
ncbi:hypothetical protein Tco_0216980 [Tanacetum coccineum]